MKAIVWIIGLLMLMPVAWVGCASSQYSAESYNQPQVLEEYIRNHPNYYQEWANEIP